MKVRLLSTGLALLFSSVMLLAQKADSLAQAQLNKPNAAISIYYPKHIIAVELGLGAASRQLPTSQLLTIGGGGTLTNADKDDLLSSASSGLNLGFEQRLSLGFFERQHQPARWGQLDYKQGISIFQQSFTGLSLSADGFALALNGNGPYAGETLDLSDTQVEDWYYSGLKYHFSFPLAKHRAFMALALLAGHSHSEFNLANTTLFTEANGSAIEVNNGYDLYQASVTNTLGIAGIGASLDFTYQAIKQGKGLTLALKDFGFMAWSNTESINRQANYTFEGITISDLGALSDSLIQAEGDALQNDLLFSEGDGYSRLTPFILEATYHYKKDSKSSWVYYASARYRYLTGFIPQGTLGASYQGFTNQYLEGGLSYGGFNTLAMQVAYAVRFGYGFSLKAQFSNVLAAITPIGSGGGFGQIGIYYTW